MDTQNRRSPNDTSVRILFCGYRKWALKLYSDLSNSLFECAQESNLAPISLALVHDLETFNKHNPADYDLVLFIGWSWIIDKKWIERKNCVCLHPSPLPKYRGGSPIQHQIINGETTSAVTLFLMDEGIDTGPIIDQAEISLLGNLDDVFLEIHRASCPMLMALIGFVRLFKELPDLIPQDEIKASFFKRRKPEMSEITTEEIKNSTAEQLHNKIRALQDPYPNAYIVGKDGKRVFLTLSKLEL